MEKQSNHEMVTQGFSLLLESLAPYIIRELVTAYGQGFWQEGGSR